MLRGGVAARRPPLPIDIAFSPGPQPHAAADGTDRRTVGRTPCRYIDPAADYANSVSASVTGRLKMTDKVAEITETELRAMPA